MLFRMLTNVYHIQRQTTALLGSKELWNLLGGGHPLFTALEGGDGNGPLYLCCVDKTVDFPRLCTEHHYKVLSAYPFEVDASLYSSKHQIELQYFKKESYRLSPI